MIEFIAFMYIAGVVGSGLVALWNLHLTRRRLNSTKLRVLNGNLEKVGLYWLSSQDDFAPREPDSVERDRSKSLRNSLLVGLMGFAGPIGFVLLLIVVVSVHFLAKSRHQMAVFKSELASGDLPQGQVEILVKQFQFS